MSQVPRSLPYTVDSGSRWKDEKPLPDIPTLTTIQTEKSLGFVVQKQPWQPKSLRTSSLAAFVALYLVLLATLAFIWVLSRRTNGFTLISENHYIWMYGPTALLILVVSLWRQVDYDCRILTPWQELEQLCRPARKTLFLDYISPLQLIALFQAIEHRHFSVIVTTLGFLTLKLVTIASTGLLSVTMVPSHINTSALEVTRHFSYVQNSLSNSIAAGNRSSPFYQAYAHLREQMMYHDGMSNDTVYQSIASLHDEQHHNVTYSATVLALSPRIKCEVPEMSIDVPSNSTNWKALPVTLRMWGSCTYDNTMTIIDNPAIVRCPPRQINQQYIMTDCGNPGDAYVLLSYSQFLFSQELNATDAAKRDGASVQALDSKWSNSGNYWLCKLELDKHIVDVSYDTSYSPSKPTIGYRSTATGGTFPEFQVANLSEEIWFATSGAGDMFSGPPMIGLMEKIVNATDETFLDLDDVSMGVAAERALHQIALQVIYQNAMEQTNTSITGTLTYIESRLEVNDPPAIFMILGLCLMSIFAIITLSKRPRCHSLTDKADTIATVIAILVGSKKCTDLIDGVRMEPEAVAQSHLENLSYSMRNPMQIDVHETTHMHDDGVQNPLSLSVSASTRWNWWLPVTLRQSIIALTILTPVVLIIVLELVQRQSDSSQGFLTLTADTSALLGSLYTRFLPALVMLLTSTLFSALDFNVAVLAPFVALKGGRSFQHSLIGRSALGKLPPISLYLAIRNSQWIVASAATAAFIGSVLTIVVSGLYTIELMHEPYPLWCDRTDVFRPMWNGSTSDDGGAAVILSLIENSNMTYPQFTHDELVFPGIALSMAAHTHSESTSSGLLQITVPALRGHLDCNPLSPPQVNSTLGSVPKYQQDIIVVQGSVPPTATCLVNREHNSSARLEFASSWSVGQGNSGTYYNGKLMDVTITDAQMGPGCPSLALTWGSREPSTNVSFFTAYICNQQIQQLDVNLTLTYPSLSIPSSNPPIPIESSVQLLPSDRHNATAFPFSLEASMKKFSAFNRTYGSASESLGIENSIFLDPFFSGVVTGQKPVDTRTLGESTQDAQNTVFDGVQALYRRYMAQVINLKMRVPNDPSGGNIITSRQNAIFIPDTGTPKMVQHRTSKLILQVMLGLMFILGLATVSIGRLYKIVPWNPCSIAGIVVLIAGSKICNSAGSRDSDSIHESHSDKTHQDVHEKTPLMERCERFGEELSAQRSSSSNPSVATSTTVPMWQSFSSHERARRRQQTQVKDVKPFDIKTARLRLGWWRDGEFMGDDGPNRKVYEVERIESNVKWRYGIDCIDL